MKKPKPDQKERGSILIAVLWSLFFLAALALVINISITPQLGLAGRLRDRAAQRYLAQAGLRRAILEIRLDETEGFDALNESWSRNEEAFKEIDLGEDRYFSVVYVPAESAGEEDDAKEYYGLTDEERKLNVNAATAGMLKQFFEVGGEMSSQDATDIADAIIDWRDEDDEPLDNGAESSYYEALSEAYPCKNGKFDVLEELLLVKGVTPDVFDKVKSHLTVFGSGQVNVNTAGELVLQGLGMSPELAERIVLFRQGNDGVAGTEDDNIFEDAGSIASVFSGGGGLSPAERDELNAIIETGFLGVRSDHFRGEAMGRFRDQESGVKIIFVINRNEQIRYWLES